MTIIAFGIGHTDRPLGVAGGKPGTLVDHWVEKHDTRDKLRRLSNIGIFEAKEDEDWVCYANGGGGYGDPLKRDPEIVRDDARNFIVSVEAAREQYARLLDRGLKLSGPGQLVAAVQAVQQCLTHVAMLKAICEMFDRGAGSRGSHCILDEGGIEMHGALIDPASGRPYRFKQENESLRDEILQLTYDPGAPDLFGVDIVEPRAVPDRDVAFEVAWSEFRGGKIYEL